MKVTAEFEVVPLGKDQLLAFYTEIGTAELDGRTFEITRSLSGLQFGLYEKVDGLTVVHTVNVNPIIQAALESIIGERDDAPMPEPVVEYGLRDPDGFVMVVRAEPDWELSVEELVRKRVHDTPDYWTGVTRKVSTSEWEPLP